MHGRKYRKGSGCCKEHKYGNENIIRLIAFEDEVCNLLMALAISTRELGHRRLTKLAPTIGNTDDKTNLSIAATNWVTEGSTLSKTSSELYISA